jgi:SAM-dependent methyltransferase
MHSIEEKSLTHRYQKDILSHEEVSEKIKAIKTRLVEKYENQTEEYNERLKLLNDLSEFELGRFLIYNGSLSGYWTHYVISGYKEKSLNNAAEKSLLENTPVLCATRERFNIFQQLLTPLIRANMVCCSIPCGLMTEYLTLEIDKDIKNIKFVGIDLDATLFDEIKKLVKKYHKSDDNFSFLKKDAWEINITEEFDVLTSNGLNIYEKDDERIITLYKNFFGTLKPGGVFIGSALSTPEEWDKEKISPVHLEFQKKIFADILAVNWSQFRTREKSESQLKSAGFEDIQFYWDTQKMFYTFTARKP